MAFGLSAGTIASIAGAGIGLLSNRGTTPATQTQTNQIDPRIANYLYGSDGKTGLLDDARALYEKNKTGLNPQILAGMNQRMNVYQSPAAQQGYNEMGSLGRSLMGQGVASNPFTNGQGVNFQQPQTQMQQFPMPGQQPAQQGNFRGQQQPQGLLANQPTAQAPATPTAPVTSQPSQFSDATINEYVRGHENNPQDILAQANRYGISLDDIARATGYSHGDITKYMGDTGLRADQFKGNPGVTKPSQFSAGYGPGMAQQSPFTMPVQAPTATPAPAASTAPTDYAAAQAEEQRKWWLDPSNNPYAGFGGGTGR